MIKMWLTLGALLGALSANAASNFVISPSRELPTQIILGESITASYTLTNMTSSARVGYRVQGLPATVTQDTTAPNCGNPINLEAKASCTLALKISAPVSSNFALCKGSSCTTATTPLNVALYTSEKPRYLYVADYSNSGSPATLCKLDKDTGAILSCGPSGGGSTIYSPQGVAASSSGQWIYFSGKYSVSYDVYQCPLNFDGTLEPCTSTTIIEPTTFVTDFGTAVLSPTNPLIYFSGSYASTPSVIACPLIDGVISPICTNMNAPLHLYQTGVTINKAGTKAYMANYTFSNAVVTVCDVSADGLTFSNCLDKTGGGPFNFGSVLGDLAVNISDDILYIADRDSNRVYGCSTNPNLTNRFDSCFIAGNFIQAWGLAINSTTTVAYVGMFHGDSVYTCPVGSDGTFNNCVITSGFGQANSMAFKR